MSSLSDVVREQTAQADHDEISPLMRKVERNGATASRLPRSLRAAEAGGTKITDPLLQGLIERLPKPDGAWSLDARAKWLDIASRIFELVYSAGDNEQRKIEVEIVEPYKSTRLSREGNVVVAPSLSKRLREEHCTEASKDTGDQ